MDRGKGSAMKRTSGFTIIEVLVVVGIVAVLMGLLFPAVGMVQKSGRASASQSNLRQWATGTMGFLNINREQLPWEGLKDANDMPTNLAERRFWANAIPPMVGQRPYREIVDQCFAESVNVPMPEDGTIFCDPAAVPEGDAPYAYGQPGRQRLGAASSSSTTSPTPSSTTPTSRRTASRSTRRTRRCGWRRSRVRTPRS